MNAYEIIKTLQGFHYLALGIDILLLLVCLIFLIMAIIRWKKHPFVSIIAIPSILLAGASSIVYFVVYFYLFELKTNRIMSLDSKDKFYDLALSHQNSSGILLILFSILQFVLVTLLISAIFVGRRKSESSQTEKISTK